MLELTRSYVAYILAGYGEPEVSVAILNTSDESFRHVQNAANRAAAQSEEWLKVACRVAVEIVEGEHRELRRRQLVSKDMPSDLLAADREAQAERVRALSVGEPVKKKEIFSRLATAIAPELPGYKYLASRSQFEKAFAAGKAYVTLCRGRSIVYLGFGVTHDGIERTEHLCFGSRGAGTTQSRQAETLVVISLNIGPRTHYWPHVIDANWLILGEAGIELASREAAAFTREVVAPFVNRNQTPARIRDTLLSIPGRIASLRPERTVFAIDHLERRSDWLEADFAAFQERFKEFAPGKLEDLANAYRATRERWGSRE